MKIKRISDHRLDAPTFTLAVIGAITIIIGAALMFTPLALYSWHWWVR